VPGSRPMSQLLAEYSRSHTHPVNRFCHTFGIPIASWRFLFVGLRWWLAKMRGQA